MDTYEMTAMSYEAYRRENLRRLGIRQLPPLVAFDEPVVEVQSQEWHLPIRTMPVPGRRCPACLSRGQTVWVIPGKRCPQCGTEVN